MLTMHYREKNAIIPYPESIAIIRKLLKKVFAFKIKTKTFEEESIQNNAFLFKLLIPIKDY